MVPRFIPLKMVGRGLKYSETILRKAFHALVYIMVFTGKEYLCLTKEDIDAYEEALRAHDPSQGGSFPLRTFTNIT